MGTSTASAATEDAAAVTVSRFAGSKFWSGVPSGTPCPVAKPLPIASIVPFPAASSGDGGSYIPNFDWKRVDQSPPGTSSPYFMPLFLAVSADGNSIVLQLEIGRAAWRARG